MLDILIEGRYIFVKKAIRILMILLTLLCICFSAVGCSGQSESEDVSKEIYTPEVNAENEISNTVEAKIGTINQKYYHEAAYENPYIETIAFETDGVVSSINVENGNNVKKGAVLALLNTDEIDKKIEEQKLRLDSAKKTLSRLNKNKKADKTEKISAEYDVQIEQNAYDRLLFEREKYTVKAPYKGEISIQYEEGKEIKKGSHVSAGQPLCTMKDPNGERLCIMIYNQERFEDVSFGMNVTLTQGKTTESGKITDIVFSDGGGSYDAYYYVITPDKKNSELVSYGDEINASIDVYSKENVVIVPTEAIKTVNDTNYVDVLVDGMKIQTDVEIGIQDDAETEIISGLSGGEQIILPSV